MARDYKHRAYSHSSRGAKVPVGRWILVLALIGGFVWFLLSLRGKAPDGPQQTAIKVAPVPVKKAAPEKKPQQQAKREPVEPRFEFYTILPEDEVVIPDHEIKTTKREEALGHTPAKTGSYYLQAGSFRSFKEADRLKAQLALLGIEAKIEIAKVGGATWNRIKIGPYANMASVDKIRSRLRQNKIDAVVLKSAR